MVRTYYLHIDVDWIQTKHPNATRHQCYPQSHHPSIFICLLHWAFLHSLENTSNQHFRPFCVNIFFFFFPSVILLCTWLHSMLCKHCTGVVHTANETNCLVEINWPFFAAFWWKSNLFCQTAPTYRFLFTVNSYFLI